MMDKRTKSRMHNFILVFQMHNLAVAMDALLESQANTDPDTGATVFQRERIFAQVYSGRDHRPAIRYLSKFGCFC